MLLLILFICDMYSDAVNIPGWLYITLCIITGIYIAWEW